MLFPLAVRRVRRGKRASFRAFGASMEPVIPSGSRVTIEPVDPDLLELGDPVIVEVRGTTMLHLITAIDRESRRFEIAGTSGPPDGWTPFERVHAICTRIGDEPVPRAAAKTRPRRAWRCRFC